MLIYQILYSICVFGHIGAVALAVHTWIKFNREFCDVDSRWWRFIHRFIHSSSERCYYITVLGSSYSALMGYSLIRYIIVDEASATSHEVIFIVSHILSVLVVNAAHWKCYLELLSARRDATAT